MDSRLLVQKRCDGGLRECAACSRPAPPASVAQCKNNNVRQLEISNASKQYNNSNARKR